MSKAARKSNAAARRAQRETKRSFCGVDLPEDVLAKIFCAAITKCGRTALNLRAVSTSTREAVASGLADLDTLNLSLRSDAAVAAWLLLLPSICDDTELERRDLTIHIHRPRGQHACQSRKLQLSRGSRFGARTWLLLPPLEHDGANGTAPFALDPMLVESLIASCSRMLGRAEFWRRKEVSSNVLIEELRLRPVVGKLLLHAHSTRSSVLAVLRNQKVSGVPRPLTFRGDDQYIRDLFTMTADALSILTDEKKAEARRERRLEPSPAQARIRVLVPGDAQDGQPLFSEEGQRMGERTCRNFIWP